jgi:hypothetical protein
MSQDILQISNPKICISYIPILNFAGAILHYTSIFQRYTAKSQILRFLSHISVLIFTRTVLHIIPQIWTNPSWINVPRPIKKFRSENLHFIYPFWILPEQLPIFYQIYEITHPEPIIQDSLQNSNPKICISHIPILNFAGTNRNKLHNPYVPTYPEPTKPQTPRFLSHTSIFEFCRNNSPYYTTYKSQPILNQYLKIHYIFQIRNFSSYISLYWNLPEQITPRMYANPSILKKRSKNKPQNLRPQDFHLTHPFWTLSEQLAIFPHVYEPSYPIPISQNIPLKISIFTV